MKYMYELDYSNLNIDKEKFMANLEELHYKSPRNYYYSLEAIFTQRCFWRYPLPGYPNTGAYIQHPTLTGCTWQRRDTFNYHRQKLCIIQTAWC